MKKLFALIVCLFLTFNLYAQTTIDSVRINDSTGVPRNVNKVVTVTGVVTSTTQFGASGPVSLQDSTAGIAVYGSSFSSKVLLGDSVRVSGTLTNYDGLAEMNYATGNSYSILSRGHTLVPKVVTISDILSQQWNGIENLESVLIQLNNVTISNTGNFASGGAYTISDSTGSFTSGLYINKYVTSIIGTTIPTQQVSLIGVLSQHTYNAPFSTGYQLQPRFIQDIISPDLSPLIINSVFAVEIDPNSLSICFHTLRKGISQVKYGLTSNLEMDSVIVNEDTTFHKVKISGLTAGTLYYFKVVSDNSYGRSVGGLINATTGVIDTSTGKINIYFNYAVDTSVAIPGNAALGNVDFQQKLLSRINNARYSIDMAVYSFSGLPSVADALVTARDRGVKVRVVYDSRATQDNMQTIMNAGILVSRRNTDTTDIMHNKFFVFDSRDSINSNDWVWTGSWNITSTELTWKNNVIELNDHALALAYQQEFEVMWGSNTEIPNPSLAKFGSAKSNVTPHSFIIGGRSVRSYFSPSDGVTNQIINTIYTADSSIYFAVMTFTRSDIVTAIHNRFNSTVKDVKGIMDDITGTGNQFSSLKSFVDMWANTGNTLHDKYAMVDASNPLSHPTVITGSHNWSSAAEQYNDENTLIIDDINIANQFMQDFKHRYNDLGGVGTFIVPVITGIKSEGLSDNLSYKLYQNYPNPFNPVTTIRFEVPHSQYIELKIFDILGREIKTLFKGTAPAGIMAIDFNADGFSSGIYIYRIKGDGFTASKKLMLLK
ncbi:MAG: phospholipase D-like domain-containing protein [Ignavibacteriaceae bacterium]|nr:phospholipase D-like domain-containing protein [Ignavibacteriaceae bacterium]